MHRTLPCAALVACALLVLTTLFAAGADAAPQRNAKARPGDCVACHKADKVLPAGHPATKDMKLDACLGCHAPKSGQALATRIPGGHLHMLRGVTCAQCHGKGKPAEVPMDKCASCHDTSKVSAATATLKYNPHGSPHYGKDMDCNLCHHQHGKSENYCAQCHKFELRVP
jgi:hypothetical protein